MPELPEAETVRRLLAAEVSGATVKRVELRHPRVWRHHGSPRELTRLVTGRRIIGVGRRGKAPYLLLDGDRPSTLILRLGMSGLVRVASAVTYRSNADNPAAILTLDNGMQIRFYDTRTFGSLTARRGHDIETMPEFVRYGPEPLSADFTLDYLAQALARRTAKLEDVLMNQHVIAGIGKIYADEICFHAGLRPNRRASSLTKPQVQRLLEATRRVLKAAIKCGGTSARDEAYEGGSFQRRLRVYQRDGKPCRSCGAPIRRTPLPGGRGRHWCPSCQR